MIVTIDRDGCISCGQCAQVCSEIFFMADDGIAEVKKQSIEENLLESALSAKEVCPVSVISIEA